MSDHHFPSRLITTLLFVALLGTGALWVRERSRAASAVQYLSEAKAEITRLNAALAQKKTTENGRHITPPPGVVPLPSEEASAAPPPAAAPAMVSNADRLPIMTEVQAGAIERFDVAMDQQFDRLEEREARSADQAEVTTIQKIKDQLTALDELYRRADLATSPEDQMVIRQEMQQVMGSIIGLSRVDRNERLGTLASQIGYTDPQAVEKFIQEIDRIYVETHMDWTKLFNRAPPE